MTPKIALLKAFEVNYLSYFSDLRYIGEYNSKTFDPSLPTLDLVNLAANLATLLSDIGLAAVGLTCG